MRFGSLFSGIGGLDLGLERAGMECVWQSEIDPHCSRVLAKHWPNTPNLGDINGIEWERVPAVDVICGGYPCQPFSYAGHRNGADDPRHLWPRFFDAIRILRPRFALLENVPGHLSLGFGQVLADLASIGYDTQWDCIPAASVGAPHRRDRVFVIASRSDMVNTDHSRGGASGDDSERTRSQGVEVWEWPGPFDRVSGSSEDVADTGRKPSQIPAAGRQPTEPQSERNTWWQTEPNVGRVAHGIPRRMDRLRGLGNAVVPQVAEHVGNIIMGMADD